MVNGTEIIGTSGARALAHGVTLIPEYRLVFPSISVEENLRAGTYRRDASLLFADLKERMKTMTADYNANFSP